MYKVFIPLSVFQTVEIGFNFYVQDRRITETITNIASMDILSNSNFCDKYYFPMFYKQRCQRLQF